MGFKREEHLGVEEEEEEGGASLFLHFFFSNKVPLLFFFFSNLSFPLFILHDFFISKN